MDRFILFGRKIHVLSGVRQSLVKHPAAVEGAATGGQRNGYTDFQ